MRAYGCGSASKDLCTLQRGRQRVFLYFSFTFIFFSALLYMYIFLVPSACSLRFGSKILKVNVDDTIPFKLFLPKYSVICNDKKNYYWLFNHFYRWRELIFMFFMQLLLGLETNRVQWCSPLIFFFRFCCDIITLAVSAWSNWAYTVWGLFFDRLCTTFSGMDQTCVRMITVWKRLLDQT